MAFGALRNQIQAKNITLTANLTWNKNDAEFNKVNIFST
jgi:hypothetical protein